MRSSNTIHYLGIHEREVISLSFQSYYSEEVFSMHAGLAMFSSFVFGIVCSVAVFDFKQRRMLRQIREIQSQHKLLDYRVQTLIGNHVRLTTQLQQRQTANTSSLLSD